MKNKYLYIFLLLMAVATFSCGHKSDDTSSGTAALDWKAPDTNSDGSALTDLGGYKVYYGTSSGSYPQSINVGNVTSFQVTNLPRGFRYYFVVTAYNQAGVESDPSDEASKAIN